MRIARAGEELSAIRAAAGKLWLEAGGADPEGAVQRAIDAYWAAQAGEDPYWNAMSERMACDGCGEVSRLENLALCPNCFRAYCYRLAATVPAVIGR